VFHDLPELKTRKPNAGERVSGSLQVFPPNLLAEHTQGVPTQIGRSLARVETFEPQKYAYSRRRTCFRLKKQTARNVLAVGSYLLSPVYRTYSTEIPNHTVATSRFIAHQAWLVYHTFFPIAIVFAKFFCKCFMNIYCCFWSL
jgi:hypothetical protein